MVEKFEAGKWYKDIFSREECPFFIEKVNGRKVTMLFWDSFEGRARRDIIEPNKIRPGYYHDFREVSKDELSEMIRSYGSEMKFLKNKCR